MYWKMKRLAEWNFWLSLIKNGSWIVVVIASALYALAIKGQALSIIAIVSCGCLLWTSGRLFVLERRLKRLNGGFRYFHQLVHQLRDGFSSQESLKANLSFIPLPFSESSGKVPEVELKSAEPEDVEAVIIHGLLRKVLDNTAHYFREVTGAHCTVSLILPFRSNEEIDYFLSVLYCSNVDPERVAGTVRQKAGLCFGAFAATKAMIYNNYEEEMRKGNFHPTRQDWQRWYASGIMTPFRAGGKRYGILNIDCKKTNVFRESHAEIAAGFADACGLVLNPCIK
jgi:hypothetical protein